MNVFDWLVMTNPGAKGIDRTEKAKRVELRTRVCEKAGTSINILINAKCRGAIGQDLINRMVNATRDESLKIIVKNHG